jgi:hypothetical protein
MSDSTEIQELQLHWNGCPFALSVRRTMCCYSCNSLSKVSSIHEKIKMWCESCDCVSCLSENPSLERCIQFPDHNNSFCEHRESYIKCLKQLILCNFISKIKTNYVDKDAKNIICKKFPLGIDKMIEQNLLELYLTEIKHNYIMDFNQIFANKSGEPRDQPWLERRLQIVLQHLAYEYQIQVTQFTGNRVGQSILFLQKQNNQPDQLIELGRSWNKNDGFLHAWSTLRFAFKEYINWTEEDWQNHVGLLTQYVDQKYTKVCLMFDPSLIPQTIPEFKEFKLLRLGYYLMRYPCFIPVYINIPTQYLFVEEINNNVVN